MITRLFCLFLSTLGLSACNLGGQQSLPPLAVPKQFPAVTSEYKSIRNLPYYHWWLQFNDSELNRLVELGLKNNPDVHIALANLQQARDELLKVRLSWIPTLEILGGYSTNPALGVPGAFYGVWPNYALNIANLMTRKKQAQYSVDYQRAAINATRLVLIGQIASAYFTYLAEQEQLHLLKQLNSDLKELVALSRKDMEIGLKNEIDVAQLVVAQKLTLAQMPKIKHNITISQNALRFLLNQNPGAVPSKNNFSHIDFSQFKPSSLPVHVLCNRPDLKMAEYALKRSHADIAVSLSDFFPNIQLGDFNGEAHLPDSQFAQATDAYLNASIKPAAFANVKVKKAAYRAQMVRYIKTARQALKEVDNDLSANKRAEQTYRTSLRAENAYRHKYQLQQGLLKTGLISYKTLLDSKLELDNLALTTNQTKLKLALSLVLLYQDLAGGYEAECCKQTRLKG